MSRVVIAIVHGSAGDVHPYVAIALGLRARGHEVVFAVDAPAAEMLAGLGFVIQTLPGGGVAANASRQERDVLRRAIYGDPSLAFEGRFAVISAIDLPAFRVQAAPLAEVCRGADLIICQSEILGSLAADAARVPWLRTAANPIDIASDSYSPLRPVRCTPPGPLGRAVNGIRWSSFRGALRRRFSARLNEIRAQLGLRPRHDWYAAPGRARVPTGVIVSAALFPRPPDWPENVIETGFCFWDNAARWREPDGLRDFLARPGPLVAVNTGSMGPRHKAPFEFFFHSSLTAIARVGARALVIGAADGALPSGANSGVFAVPYAPFSEVYPYCAAVVQHGGVGTVAQALRAGVPSIIVPWGSDQYFTGARVARARVGRYVLRPQYCAERATRELRSLLDDPRYAERAALVGRRIASEDGVATFCDLAERVALRTT